MIRVGYSPQITPKPGARAVTRETSLDMKRLHKWPSQREGRMSNISKTVPREQSQVCPRLGFGFRNTPPSRYTRDATAGGTRVALGSPGACLSDASSPTHLRTKSLVHAGTCQIGHTTIFQKFKFDALSQSSFSKHQGLTNSSRAKLGHDDGNLVRCWCLS